MNAAFRGEISQDFKLKLSAKAWICRVDKELWNIGGEHTLYFISVFCHALALSLITYWALSSHGGNVR